MSQTHKECAANEIWIGNAERNGEHFQFLKSQGLTSARLGNQAYDIYGKALPDHYAPVIIARSQADRHHAIMMEKTFGPNWRRA